VRAPGELGGDRVVAARAGKQGKRSAAAGEQFSQRSHRPTVGLSIPRRRCSTAQRQDRERDVAFQQRVECPRDASGRRLRPVRDRRPEADQVLPQSADRNRAALRGTRVDLLEQLGPDLRAEHCFHLGGVQAFAAAVRHEPGHASRRCPGEPDSPELA
jgi:hypothetical protein